MSKLRILLICVFLLVGLAASATEALTVQSQKGLSNVVFLDPAEFNTVIGPYDKPRQLVKWTAIEKKRVYEALCLVNARAPGLVQRASNGGSINFFRSHSKSNSMAETDPGAAYIQIFDNWFLDKRKGFKEYSLAHELVHYVDSSFHLTYSLPWNRVITPHLYSYRSKHEKRRSSRRRELLELDATRFGLPSDYAATNTKEALAECAAAMAMCSWRAPAKISEFIEANVLSRPDSIDTQLQLLKEASIDAMFRKDYSKARTLYYQLLRSNPECEPALINLTYIWSDCQEPEMAEYCRVQASRVLNASGAPRDSEHVIYCTKLAKAQILRQLARLAMREGQPELALEHLNQALEIQPDRTGAYLKRGECYLKLGEYQKALTDYDHYLEFHPDDIQAKRDREKVRQLKLPGGSNKKH